MSHHAPATGKRLAGLSLAALGIVYGDIGTSPLYAFRESIAGEHGAGSSEASVIGVLSLIFWAITLVVSLKYVLIVLRANNGGEGGILALLSLAFPERRGLRATGWFTTGMMSLGVVGACLLYGDGIITPAISVLSAVEGFEVATPAFSDWVIPIAVVILIALFAVQQRASAGIAKILFFVFIVLFAVSALFGALRGRPPAA